MKKLFLILAIIVAYGAATSTASAKTLKADKASISVVADNNDTTSPDGENDKKEGAKTAKTEGCTGKAAKTEGCAGEKASGCSETAKKSCCGGEKASKACEDKKK